MDNFKELIRKRLSQQYHGKNIIGSIAVNEIKDYFDLKKIDPEIEEEILTGYVRHDKVFIKTLDQNLKIQLFKEKSNVIEAINKKLQNIGYTQNINDIILK